MPNIERIEIRARDLRAGDVLRYGTVVRLDKWRHDGQTWVRAYTADLKPHAHNGATRLRVQRPISEVTSSEL